MTSSLRCAIYTRVSSDAGLEQDFNSLDAQRESAEAYIKSQAHEGWQLVRERFDDGGYSGGSTDRPALQRLLDRIRERRVDVVVVYKVDRLTRSLADFAKIVEALDAKSVSFVSVTQAFNTTSSMGRLTLNVLLSFAQFEREVTGERIRDKIAASKRKGMWMGGLPSLGYNVKDRKLVINETEAEIVRQIFRGYVALGSVRALKEELDTAGVLSKRRVAADGTPYGGKPFSRGALYLMLQNRIYRGEIVHKGTAYRGEHVAIVDEALWAEVQRTLQGHRVERRATVTKSDALLAGLLFDAEGEAMTPTHAVKKGTRYRYYVSRRLMVGTANKSVCDGQRIPGANLEDLIIRRVRTFVADPLALLNAVSKGRFGAPLQKKLKEAAEDLLRSWDNEPSADAVSAFLRTILIRVRMHADRIEVEVDATRVAEFLLPESTMFGRYRPPPSPAPTPTRRMTNTRSSHSSYQLSSSAREKSLSSSSRALRNAHHPTRASSGSYFGLMLSASV